MSTEFKQAIGTAAYESLPVDGGRGRSGQIEDAVRKGHREVLRSLATGAAALNEMLSLALRVDNAQPGLVAFVLSLGADPRLVDDCGGYSPLHLAMQPDSLRALLAAGADPNARDRVGGTALHATSFDAHKVRLLLAAGADPRATNTLGETALHKAYAPEVVAALLAGGADPNARARFRGSPLHTAQTARAVALLLAAGADPHATDASGATPLHKAVDAESARLLLAAGAKVDARDARGRRPLELALGSTSTPKLGTLLPLLTAGAEPNLPDKDGNPPLSRLLARLGPHADGSVALVRALLEAGADPIGGELRGMSPLSMALHHARPDIARLLVHAGARPLQEEPAVQLAWCAAVGDLTGVAQLLDAGVCADGFWGCGDKSAQRCASPLQLAALAGSLPVVDRLLTAGAAVDAGSTDALQVAAGRLDHAIVARLLPEGPRKIQGALFTAIRAADDPRLATLLLDAGADALCALKVALSSERPQILGLLLDRIDAADAASTPGLGRIFAEALLTRRPAVSVGPGAGG